MSEIWLQKLTTFFKRLDFDGDGSLTKKDFFGMADRFTKQGNYNEEEAKAFKDKFLEVQ